LDPPDQRVLREMLVYPAKMVLKELLVIVDRRGFKGFKAQLVQTESRGTPDRLAGRDFRGLPDHRELPDQTESRGYRELLVHRELLDHRETQARQVLSLDPLAGRVQHL
jgi:hypothetical protein